MTAVGRREFTLGLCAATALPLAAHPQQRSGVPAIGFLSGQAEAGNHAATAAFHAGLREFGYVEGENCEILCRWADTAYDRLPGLAADLVRSRLSLSFAGGGVAAALAAKSVTAGIPIVFVAGADPVMLGLVTSLNRPGGNITGATVLFQSLIAKRVELLREAVPRAFSMGFLVNPGTNDADAQIVEFEKITKNLALQSVILRATTPGEIEVALAKIAGQRIGGLVVGGDPLFFNDRDRIAALAIWHGLPAIYHTREMVEAGGLMSYGPSISDAYRIAGTYAGRILKGEKPADLPVQQSTRIETLVNLKAAKAINLEVPTETLLRADEVIE